MSPSVLLLRHGETEWNRIGRLQGRDDSPLTERGRTQAEALARLASALGVARVIASPLGRAQATAERVASACGVAVQTEPALAETDFGACSGLTHAELEARFPGLQAARALDRWHHAWPGGESYAIMQARLETWLAAAGDPRSAPPTALVAHQGLHRALLVALGAATREQALEGAQSPEHVLRVHADGRIEHLVAPASLPARTPQG